MATQGRSQLAVENHSPTVAPSPFDPKEATGRRTTWIGDLRRCDSKLRITYGTIQVMFRAGPNPTGIRAVSFRDLISTTETSFVCSFAT